MVALALCIPLMSILLHILWEFVCYYAIEVGHRTHTALKVLLFKKNLRMTGATNKDFSSSEINSVIMNDSEGMWPFMWNGPEYLETAFHIVSSSTIIFQQVGWCGLIVLVFQALQMLQ